MVFITIAKYDLTTGNVKAEENFEPKPSPIYLSICVFNNTKVEKCALTAVNVTPIVNYNVCIT